MRLLLITNVFPSPLQPTKGVFNLEMARALARGHEVCVVAPVSWVDELRARLRGGGARPGRRARTAEGVEVHHPRYYYTPKVLRRYYGRFFGWSAGGTVRRRLASHRPDVVLGYWAHPDGELAVKAARAAGVPGVVMVGGTDVLLLARDPSRRARILKVLDAADAVVAVSHDIKEVLTGYGVRGDKVHVVGRGVDVGKFAPGDRPEARRRLGIGAGARVLLWVGRMVPVKGLDVLLNACSLLKERRVDFTLYLVGDGPLRERLEADARGAGLSGSVSFVGSQPHERLADWYRAADLTVLPSRSEGVPNVLRESLACGTPFVASRVGGIPELADGPPNRLVPPGDPAALCGAIAEALDDPGRGAGPAPRVASLEDAAEALTRVLESLTPASARGGPRPVAASGAPGGPR